MDPLAFFRFLYIVSVFRAINSARILGLFPTHSRSHLIVHTAIAEALAERGHNVTIVATYASLRKENQPLPYRYLHLDIPTVSDDFFSKAIKVPSYFKMINNFHDAIVRLSNASLNHPLMKKLMHEESFDLVVQGYLLNSFLFGVAAHFKCPLVLSTSLPPDITINNFVGNPQEFAYVPTILTNGKQPIEFFERVKNFFTIIIGGNFILREYIEYHQNRFYRSNFPADKYPTLSSMEKNVSLVLTNHHFSQTPLRPNVPAVVEIGGIQIKDKLDPLPEDIQTILDNSLKNGVIYFSLGTSIQKSNLNDTKVKILFEVLSKLPQTILCKWSDQELPLVSRNIFYKKWLPQVDVLRHRSVKLFITHGGLGGMTEAQYHGVPMVGIPFFSDQYANVQNMQESGHGLVLDFATLNEAIARRKIGEVLSNRSYTENIQRFSRIYRDRPMSAKELAVYWVEYVLRHHGASHMQSPAAHMNFFQLLSLDVIGFCMCVSYVIFKALKMLLLLLKSIFWRYKAKQE